MFSPFLTKNIPRTNGLARSLVAQPTFEMRSVVPLITLALASSGYVRAFICAFPNVCCCPTRCESNNFSSAASRDKCH